MASSSGSVAAGTAGSVGWKNPTVDVASGGNGSAFHSANDFSTAGDGDEASKAVTPSPNDQKAHASPSSAVAAIVAVVMAGVIVAVGMLVYAWRTSRRNEEEMFMDLGDERNYIYGDYAAM